MADAQAASAQLLVCRNSAAPNGLALRPYVLPVNQQVPGSPRGPARRWPPWRPLPARYGVALLPGTMPFAAPGTTRERLVHCRRCSPLS
jgi:hypothetical protein